MVATFPSTIEANDFHLGQVVKKIFSEREVSPYVGKVVGIDKKADRVWVQWPWSVDSEEPTWLVSIDDSYVGNPDYSGKYSDLISNRGASTSFSSRIASDYRAKLDPLYSVGAEEYNRGKTASEISETLYSQFGTRVSSSTVDYVVGKFFRDSSNDGIKLACQCSPGDAEMVCRCGACLKVSHLETKYATCPSCSTIHTSEEKTDSSKDRLRKVSRLLPVLDDVVLLGARALRRDDGSY